MSTLSERLRENENREINEALKGLVMERAEYRPTGGGDNELSLTGYYSHLAEDGLAPDRVTVFLGFNDFGMWVQGERR